MKTYSLTVLLFSILITSLCFAQIPKYQRLAIPEMNFSLTKEHPSKTITAFCLDGDIYVPRNLDEQPSALYTKVLSDPENVKVYIGNSTPINLQTAIDRKLLQITLYSELGVGFKNRTNLPIRVQVSRNAMLGTESINQDLNIGTLSPAADGFNGMDYKKKQDIIWKERLLQKQGLKSDAVDGDITNDRASIEKFQRKLDIDPVGEKADETTELTMKLWEERNVQEKLIKDIKIKYDDLFQGKEPDDIKLTEILDQLYRFQQESKIDVPKGVINHNTYQFLEGYSKIKHYLGRRDASFTVERDGNRLFVPYGRELLEIEDVPGSSRFIVHNREPITWNTISSIQQKKAAFLQQQVTDNTYNYIYLGSINNGKMDFYYNGKKFSIELQNSDDYDQLYSKIQTATGSDLKDNKQMLFLGDVFQDNSLIDLYQMEQEKIYWVDVPSFAHFAEDKLGVGRVSYVRDIETFNSITSDNQVLKQTFLSFDKIEGIQYSYGLVDIRTSGSSTQVVFKGQNGAPKVWQFAREINMSEIRKACEEYGNGLLRMDELKDRTKDYVDILEEIRKKSGVKRIVSVEHNELDASLLWALHGKDPNIYFYRDNPDFQKSLDNAQQTVIPVVDLSFLLVSNTGDTTSKAKFSTLRNLGVKTVFSDSLKAFVNALKNPAYKQINMVIRVRDDRFAFVDDILSYEDMREILQGMNSGKDYIHLVTNGDAKLLELFAGSGKFKRVILTQYQEGDHESYSNAINAMLSFFGYFTPAITYLDDDDFLFTGTLLRDTRNILGNNFVKLQDGRYKIQLHKISQIQRKQLNSHNNFYDDIRQKSVLPNKNSERAPGNIDDLLKKVGIEQIRKFEIKQGKRNYLLGIPRWKVNVPKKSPSSPC